MEESNLSAQETSSPPVQNPTPTGNSSNIPISTPPLSPERPRSKLKKALAIIVGVVLVIAGITGYFLFQVFQEDPKVAPTVTSFLQDVSDDDLESAYAFTSDKFKEGVLFEDFAEFVSTPLGQALFTEFEEQNQTEFKVEISLRGPTLYRYIGTITYTDGNQGDLEVTLVKEEGEWKIFWVDVSVGLERMEKFQ